jgi:hypothetical protein
MDSFRCAIILLGILGSAQAALGETGSQIPTHEDGMNAGLAEGFAPFAWTISSSPVDPNQNTATPTFGLQVVYLWMCRSGLGIPPCTGGLLSAQFGFIATVGGPTVLAVIPANGFLNSGSATCLQLSAAGCPTGPILAAQILILSQPGNICFTACNEQDPSNPLQGGVGCDDPGFFPMAWTGLDLGAGPCSQGFTCLQEGDSGGACCMPDHTCVNTSTSCECLELGGEPQGFFTGCTIGACCLPDGSCVEVEDFSACGVCAALGGEFHFLADCDSVDCKPTSIESNSWGRTKARYR